jgi:hypothetical protein
MRRLFLLVPWHEESAQDASGSCRVPVQCPSRWNSSVPKELSLRLEQNRLITRDRLADAVATACQHLGCPASELRVSINTDGTVAVRRVRASGR